MNTQPTLQEVRSKIIELEFQQQQLRRERAKLLEQLRKLKQIGKNIQHNEKQTNINKKQ